MPKEPTAEERSAQFSKPCRLRNDGRHEPHCQCPPCYAWRRLSGAFREAERNAAEAARREVWEAIIRICETLSQTPGTDNSRVLSAEDHLPDPGPAPTEE